MDVARARAENRFNADFYATYGLTQSAIDLGNSYKKPEDQQTAIIGVTVPIVDWGLGKGKYKMALSGEEMIKTSVQQQLIDFEQNVYLQVMQFNMQDDQCAIARKADTIAGFRYDVSLQRFLIGKIDVLNLNVALTEKDEAKRNYIGALQTFWNYYFNIRKLTLFDFEKQEPLSADFEGLAE
ncbi:MAG: TolC family protein [Bacteroidetes bacterium]|nr:TolC family protein [Bacteroidota bacterium]